ncbi:MAG: flagellar FliJ family protein [Armatimonadetes bacterium]|nr:flagellar FliJ family protein [Armatimonadota bacterium]
MRRFVFPLRSVLKLRRVQEDAASRDLATVRAQREREEGLLANLHRLWQQTAENLRTAATANQVAHLPSLSARLKRLEEHIAATALRLDALRIREAQAYEKLLEAARQRGVVEKLHDRRLREFKAEERRRLTCAIDELATLRHGRKPW